MLVILKRYKKNIKRGLSKTGFKVFRMFLALLAGKKKEAMALLLHWPRFPLEADVSPLQLGRFLGELTPKRSSAFVLLFYMATGVNGENP